MSMSIRTALVLAALAAVTACAQPQPEPAPPVVMEPAPTGKYR